MRDLEEIIGHIRALCQRSISEGEFSYEHNAELEELCAALSANTQPDTWATLLFKLIEEFEEDVDLTLGSPGPLVHTLEETAPIYEEHLLASLVRKPTTIAIWMVERISRTPGKDKGFWLSKIESVASHPKITATLKRDLEIEEEIEAIAKREPAFVVKQDGN